jgi:ribosomal protein L11 methylase PrmA
LETASKLLPFKSRFSLNILLHIHFQAAYKKQNPTNKKYTISKNRLFALIDSLESTIKNLCFKNNAIGWTNYYSETVLHADYISSKLQIIESILAKLSINSALDLGANNGYFSKILSSRKIKTVSSDFDSACVNELYVSCKKNKTETLLPLVIDIANPTPAIGWDNTERSSFLSRAHFDLTLALALVHHLAIGKNIPLSKIAETLSTISTFLIVEFVPKNDIKVQLLLQNRKDIFDEYTVENFEQEFLNYYTLRSKEEIKNTERVIYLFEKKQ